MRNDGCLNLILRLLWFYFAGLWLGSIWLAIAWIACLTIIGLPLGVWMVNLAPKIMTLKSSEHFKTFEYDGQLVHALKRLEQSTLVVRILWFIVVGWWFSLLWLVIADICAASFIGLPVAFWMINRLPWVMTLRRT